MEWTQHWGGGGSIVRCFEVFIQRDIVWLLPRHSNTAKCTWNGNLLSLTVGYKVGQNYQNYIYRGANKSLARPGRKQANVSLIMVWISFGALPCRKRNLMAACISILLKSRASLTCFRACFLSGRAKDLLAPRYIYIYYILVWSLSSETLQLYMYALLSYSFFWVIPHRLNFTCRRFGTHCSIGPVNVPKRRWINY